MSSPAPRIPEDHPAVEELAKRLHHEGERARGRASDWSKASNATQRTYYARAKQYVTAIRPLLCGDLEEERGQAQKLEDCEPSDRASIYHTRAEIAEHKLAEVRAEDELHDLKFGSRSYTPEQAAAIADTVANRAPLPAAAIEAHGCDGAIILDNGCCEKCGEQVVSYLPEADPEVPRCGKEGDYERVARAFHGIYEATAPDHGYETRPESRVAWQDVPEKNRALMIGTVRRLAEAGVISIPGCPPAGLEGRWRIEDSGDWLSRYDALTRAEAIKHTAERLGEFFKSEGEPCTDEEAADEATEIVDAAHAAPNAEQEQDGVCVTYVVATSTQPPSPQAELQDCENCGGKGWFIGGDAPHDETPVKETCPDCNGTGKQSPAEPQECTPSKEMHGDANPKCISNEPQGDDESRNRAIEALAIQLAPPRLWAETTDHNKRKLVKGAEEFLEAIKPELRAWLVPASPELQGGVVDSGSGS